VHPDAATLLNAQVMWAQKQHPFDTTADFAGGAGLARKLLPE
jgi:hypothetical protein